MPAAILRRSREEQADRAAVGQAARGEMHGLSFQTDEARLQRIRALGTIALVSDGGRAYLSHSLYTMR